MFREGDIVEIPLPDQRVALGWLLHKSKVFKDEVGFVVFGIKGASRKIEFEATDALNVLGPLYTHHAALEHYGWRVVGHQPISDSKRLLTKRKVGGGVYVGDEYRGPVDEQGESTLAEMQVLGMPAVYQRVSTAFP
jgi:hypothetical protein